MKILGISAYYHDSSAALLIDNTVVAAAQEERFTRIKHDNSFPVNACRFCLQKAGLELSEIDVVVFYEKPFLKFERILVSQISSFPKSLPMFLKSTPIWLKDKLNMRRLIRKELKSIFGLAPKEIKFVEHHLSHAVLAYCTSGYKKSDILVVDAVGEWTTTSIMRAEGTSFEIVKEQRFPDSIGMLYSAFTQYLGFKVNSDEYKVMGLAPYGIERDPQTQNYIRIIETNLLSFKDGFPILNLSYFSFTYGDSIINRAKWERLFDLRIRKENDIIAQTHKNLAFAIQKVTEDILFGLISSMKKESGINNLCLCGGVALNCAANGALLQQKAYSNMFVPFAPGDCGCSIGAALAYAMIFSGNSHYHVSPFLGPEYTHAEIKQTLIDNQLNFVEINDEKELCNHTAGLIADNKIIGWFQGRMEFGPRALGNRSILADARNPKMKEMVNSRIKFREAFRPFAPSVTADDASIIFNECQNSPYMMFTYQVNSKVLPAITHVDNSARVQTVSFKDNPRYHTLLESFKEITGCPVVLNTSFNIMGEPIVMSPQDAINTFNNSGLDYLIIGNFIVEK